MAKKRFTDIEIWDKEWYMELSPKHKCLMKYIFDKCDASGCWKPNWKLASLHINENVEVKDLKSLPNDQYEILSNGKIFIPDFINFQYGSISKKSPAHNPVFIAIEKNNLIDRVFNRVLNNPKEEDKEEDKEKEKEEDSAAHFKNEGIAPEMYNIFKQSNKKYFHDKERDFTSCLQIAYKIGESMGLERNDVINKKKKEVLDVWEKVVLFAASDKWFSTRALYDLSNEWQRLIQSMNGKFSTITGTTGRKNLNEIV